VFDVGIKSFERESRLARSQQDTFKRTQQVVFMLLVWVHSVVPAYCQTIAAQKQEEPGANTVIEPKQILRTGIDLTKKSLSPNTLQLADTIGFTPVLKRVEELRNKVDALGGAVSLEKLDARQSLNEALMDGALIIQRSSLDIDFALAEIAAEQEIFSSQISTFTDDRDKAVARTNAIGFVSNGILWAACEGLAIPTFKQPKYAIPSGIIGILAGVIPSIASLYTYRQLSGKKAHSRLDPNMLAKLFGYPTTVDIDYPDSVWTFLTQVPADGASSKTRVDNIVDRWISDANLKAFTDRESKRQLDILTGSAVHRKSVNISVLTARKVMLSQLAAEIMKMKRMLLELSMALHGEKELSVTHRHMPPLNR